MGPTSSCDQKLGVEDVFVPIDNVFGADRIHVMDQESFASMNLKTFYAKVTT